MKILWKTPNPSPVAAVMTISDGIKAGDADLVLPPAEISKETNSSDTSVTVKSQTVLESFAFSANIEAV